MKCKKCTINGCERAHYAKGLCEKHYWRVRLHGTIDIKERSYYKRTGLPKKYPIEYRTYRSMLNRCYNQNYKTSEHYSGRGITVCERWLGPNGFENFLKDMGERPSNKHSLDRIDNDNGYSPDNCRWATWIEQEGNRRTNNDCVGVSRHNQNGGWSAYISIDGKRRTKCFRTKEEAVLQRKAWEKSLA